MEAFAGPMSLAAGERVLLDGAVTLLGDADEPVGVGALCVTSAFLYFAPAATTGDGPGGAGGNLAAVDRTMFRVPADSVMLHAKMPADMAVSVPTLYVQIDPTYAQGRPEAERLAAATGDAGCRLLSETTELRVVPSDAVPLAALWTAFCDQAAALGGPDDDGDAAGDEDDDGSGGGGGAAMGAKRERREKRGRPFGDEPKEDSAADADA